MRNKNHHYALVGNLSEYRRATLYGDGAGVPLSSYVAETIYSGNIFFDKEFLKSDREPNWYREGALVGKIEFVLREKQADFDGIIFVEKNNIIYEHEEQSFKLLIFCSDDLFKKLSGACNGHSEIRIGFETLEWDKNHEGEDYSAKCKVSKIEVVSEVENKRLYENKRVRHIENFLFTNLCGGLTSNQLPLICLELSKAFAEKSIFDQRNDLLAKIIPLIMSIRLLLKFKKSAIREKIEASDDAELAKIFSTCGKEFFSQLEKINEAKERRKVVDEYNSFWTRSKATDIFQNGYAWNNDDLASIVYDYLEIPYVNSPVLNSILLDALLLKDIADKAFYLRVNDFMSSAAILSVKNGEYSKAAIDTANKTIFQFFSFVSIKFFLGLLGLLVKGFMFWLITSLISGDNELAHYITFSALFATSMLIQYINKDRSVEIIKENREEKYFNILRDMCEIHEKVYHMNSNIMTHLLYKLEERHVRFDPLIYQILSRYTPALR